MLSVCLSVRPLSVRYHLLHVTLYLFTQWSDFTEICHKYSSYDMSANCWKVFQGRRSKVKVMTRPNAMTAKAGILMVCHFYDEVIDATCVRVCAKLISWRTWHGSWADCLITEWSAAVQCSTQVVFVSRLVRDCTSHRRAVTATSSASMETAAVRTYTSTIMTVYQSHSCDTTHCARLFTCLLPLCSFWKLSVFLRCSASSDILTVIHNIRVARLFAVAVHL